MINFVQNKITRKMKQLSDSINEDCSWCAYQQLAHNSRYILFNSISILNFKFPFKTSVRNDLKVLDKNQSVVL
jgi:hypothetical protein